MKLIIAGLALLTASQLYINKGYSSESLIEKNTNSEEFDESKKTYTSDGKEIQTVIALGIGTSPQGAAQNAAENALTQVVGSFIDAETILTKKTEIRDGVVAKSKELSKKISDYSQGSIKSFEILNTTQNGSIYNVTARVDVRIDDFRAYIKELAYGSKEINTGLFSVIKTEEDNIQGKLDLLAKIINPVINGEVIDIKIGNPERLREVSAFGCKFQKDNTINCPTISGYFDNLDSGIKDVNSSIVIPITFSVKKEFIENSISVLDNISDNKKNHFRSNNRLTKSETTFSNFERDNDINFWIHNAQKNESLQYLISGVVQKNNKRDKDKVVMIGRRNYGDFCNSVTKFRIILKDKSSNIINSFVRKGCDNFSSLSYNPIVNLRFLSSPFSGFPNTNYDARGNELIQDLNALLIIEPNEQLLNNLHEISIEYLQN